QRRAPGPGDDEELRVEGSRRIAPTLRRRQRTNRVVILRYLTDDRWIARSAGAIAVWIATLDDEVRRRPVPSEGVVEAVASDHVEDHDDPHEQADGDAAVARGAQALAAPHGGLAGLASDTRVLLLALPLVGTRHEPKMYSAPERRTDHTSRAGSLVRRGVPRA